MRKQRGIDNPLNLRANELLLHIAYPPVIAIFIAATFGKLVEISPDGLNEGDLRARV